MLGTIIKIISNDYTVKYNDEYYICKARGRFRNENITPLVGDHVVFDKDQKVIDEILSRKNELTRPPVANIDQALIVTSVKDPEFSSNLLDKLLVIIEFNNITPIICFTKLDLLKDNEKKDVTKYMNYYKSIGYDVVTNNDIELLKKIFNNKITVLTGQSGVGKSTLLNKFDKDLQLKTDITSKALGRGKHTTRHVELLELCNGLIADTPGFSSIDFIGMTKEDIRDSMIEFNKYKEMCEYQDCLHIKEEKCQIKDLVSKDIILQSRYDNYKKFIETK
ncbi:MAG: ribosome small subunit-dependent GTPase A [Bacilli bacterium]|nr:ribosome small subunit-dependent GTPase A [Bacilli bacterium]